MKRCKKIVSLIAICSLCSVTFLGVVCAGSKYTSSLSVDGATLVGKTRYYEAGKNTLDIKPTKLVPQEAYEYVKLRVSLFESIAATYSWRGGEDDDLYKAALGHTWTWDFGKQSKGNYVYNFATKIDGHDYGLVYAPNGNVVMQTR